MLRSRGPNLLNLSGGWIADGDAGGRAKRQRHRVLAAWNCLNNGVSGTSATVLRYGGLGIGGAGPGVQMETGQLRSVG